MGKHAHPEEGMRRLKDIIKGTHAKPQKKAPHEHLKTAVEGEQERISKLSKIIRRPSRSVMESGNIQDLKAEVESLTAKIKELARKIIEAQGKVLKIESERSSIQSEIDKLRAEEAKVSESIQPHKMAESTLREQAEAYLAQKMEEEILCDDILREYPEAQAEYKKTEKSLKALKASVATVRDEVGRMPDNLTRLDAQVTENLTKITEYEKRLAALDKDIAQAKTTLESSINQQRTLSQDYDRITVEKNNIEEAYNLYDGLDHTILDTEKVRGELTTIAQEITLKQKEIVDNEIRKKELREALEKEDERGRQIRDTLDINIGKIRGTEAKFTVYAELDHAVRELGDLERKVLEDEQKIHQSKEQLKSAQTQSAKAKAEIKAVVEREGDLKKKLGDVLKEKQKLEEELAEISATGSEKLIIELPDVLRQAIQRETEKIGKLGENIEELEKTETEAKKDINRLGDELEKDRREAKAKEKQVVYMKNKLGSAGYSEDQRLIFRKQIDALNLEGKEIEAKISASDLERKRIKSTALKTERQSQKLTDEIKELTKKTEEAKATLIRLEQEMKFSRERKVKAWAGSVPLMRLIYPLKSHMDRILDEKSKLKAELGEAARLQKKTEGDLDSAEKYVEKCRNSLSSLEEDYVQAQSGIQNANKQNTQLRMDKDSVTRQLNDKQEHIPLIEAEEQVLSAKLEELKKRINDLNNTRKQHDKNIRQADSNANKAQKRLEAAREQVKQVEEKIRSYQQKIDSLEAKMAGENTRIIQTLDEKKQFERQMEEFKRQQAITESEIRIISGIYRA